MSLSLVLVVEDEFLLLLLQYPFWKKRGSIPRRW